MNTFVTLIAGPAADPSLADAMTRAASDLAPGAEQTWLSPGRVLDLRLPSALATAEMAALREGFVAALGGAAVDVAIQAVETAGRRKKILLADMDSTMIRQECIDELAAEAGIGPRIAEITARAMNGEIGFEGALRERVGLLEGLPVGVIQRVIDNRIELMPGGPELVRTMRREGAWCALVSGGFTEFTSRIAGMIGFQENRANRLLHENGALTGRVGEPILGRQAKADALVEIAERLGLSPHDAIAVGDGANDLTMIEMAGTGVALHAKPSVAARAPIRIDHGDLTALLYVQGYRDEEFER